MKRPYKHQVRRAIKEHSRNVQAQDLIDNWHNSPLKRLQPYFLDRSYRILTLEAWETVLAWSKVDKFKYEAEHRDCDNFAMALAGRIPLEFAVNGIGFVCDFSGGHAYNAVLYYDDNKTVDIGIVEPQTDGFVVIGDNKSRSEAYKAEKGFVIFC